MSDSPKCEYCDKRGVPIFPVRYAVVSSSAGAPQPSNKPAIELPAATAQYTLRTLRSGYLYVYDEARKRWDDYFVTQDGYFFKFSGQAKGIPPVLPDKPFNCPDEGHRAVASCITIPDAKRATKVWLTFSDVQWTEDVRKRNEDASYRSKHMRCVDVKAFTASVDAKHCQPIKAVANQVAEYLLDKPALQRAAGFSPFVPQSRKGHSARLVSEADKLAPGKGFVVVLNDPVGVAAELAALMVHHATLFANDKKRQHPLTTSMAIGQIREAVEQQAVDAEIQAAEKLSRDYLAQPDLSVLISETARRRKAAQYQELRTVTPAEAKRAREKAWGKYRSKFNEAAMLSWQQQFAVESKKFDGDIIQPLAKAWIAWADGESIRQRFQCHYDENNLHSGEAYTCTAQLVINGAQDKKACLDYLAQQLAGEFTPENFLLGATVLGQKALKEQVKKAVATPSLDPRIFPADAYLGFQGGVADEIAKGEGSRLGAYLLAVNAPMVKLFNGIADKVARPLWTALAMHSGKQFVTVEVTGSKKYFRGKVIRELARLSGQVLNPHEMQRAVSAQLRNLEVAGVVLEATEKKRFAVLLDPKQVKNMPAGLKGGKAAVWLANNLKTPAQLDQIVLGEWKGTLGKAKWTIPYVGGLLAATWQLSALQKLAEDESKAMSHEAQEASQRLWAGTAALWGTVIDVAGQGTQQVAKLGLRFARGLEYAGVATSLIGRGAGLLGAVLVAFWDGQNAVDSFNKGQRWMGILYLSSAALGVVVGILAMVGAIPFFGWLAILAIMGIALLIELFKDNKVQAWLENGYWGSRQYKTVNEEINQLELAVA